jgi:hypothetical protein
MPALSTHPPPSRAHAVVETAVFKHLFLLFVLVKQSSKVSTYSPPRAHAVVKKSLDARGELVHLCQQ